MTLLEIHALLAVAFWLGLFLDRRRAWPRECVLPTAMEDLEGDTATSAGTPVSALTSVTAVVPARDEASMLPETLPALLGQEAPAVELRVVLVDDGSSDGTAEVAEGTARRAGLGEHLRILRAAPTPAGWTGKVHALACGVRAATEASGEDEGARDAEPSGWLLFTDADIRHRPGSLAALLAKAREGPYDLVSVMARLHAQTFWERLLIPPFVFYFQLLYPFREVRSRRSKVAAAAGGCVLVRRQALEAAGGVETIREAVIDDVSLAKRVAAAGGRLWLGLDPGIVSVRPYRGLGELWRMVSRSAFVQLRRRWDLLLGVLVGLAIFVVAPPFLAAAAGWKLWMGDAATSSCARALAAALGAWALEAAALWPSVRHHRVAGVWAWGLPFASILYGLMTASSAWDHLRGRGARWKGRAYR